MFASLAFGWFALLPDDYERLGKHTLGGATFVSNFVLYGEGGYWDIEGTRKILLHLWSLGVEEQYYLLFPIALFVMYKIKLPLPALIALGTIASFALNVYCSYYHYVFNFYMPFTRFWELLAGSMLALYLRKPNITKLPAKTLDILSVIGVIAIFYSAIGLHQQGFPGYQALLPVIGTSLIIYAGANAKIPFVSRVLTFRPLVGVGLISYPLYLWHWVLLSFAWIILGGWDTKSYELIELRMALIVIAVMLSIFTYYLIERPIRFGKKGKGIKTIALAIALVATGAIGGILYAKNGAPFARGSISENDMRVISEIVAKPSFWTDKTNEKICRQKFNATYYCQYADTLGAETIALVGDSHAEYAFDTVAEFNKRRGINTLLLAAPGVTNPIIGKREYTEETLTNLINDRSVRKVFIIFRGAAYFYGFDANQNDFPIISAETYKSRLQYFADRLNEADKRVYIVGENPELAKHVRYMFPLQLFYKINASLLPVKQDVFDRQKTYLEILSTIKGATIIRVIDVFCPNDKCRIFDDNGSPLYYDNNHLSVNAGGRFLVEKILKPYLEE
jgi:peptidoglycan/LPS O-acetylase OafA/YrhL